MENGILHIEEVVSVTKFHKFCFFLFFLFLSFFNENLKKRIFFFDKLITVDQNLKKHEVFG